MTAAPLLAQTFDFRQPQHSFRAASGSSGVLPNYAADEIGLDQDGDGIPDGTWTLPDEIQSTANTVLQHRLSPSQRYLITIRSRAPIFSTVICGNSIDNVEVFYHGIDPEPVLVSFGSACLRGPISIGPLWWDPDEPPSWMPIPSMVVGSPGSVPGDQPVLWADLVEGTVGIDTSTYQSNLSVTAEGIQISPLGNAVFIRHGTSTSLPDRYSMVDLCADPLGGNVSTLDEPLLTTAIEPRLVIEGSDLSAEVELIVSGAPQTQFFQLDDCSIVDPPPPPPPDPILTVTVAGSGAAAVTSTPAGIQCTFGNTCSAPFAPGTFVTLQALPGPGASLIAWSGDCSGAASTTTLVLDSDSACTATFGAIALAIDKTAAPSRVRQGDELMYSLTYRNDGTLGATNVVVRDTLPAGSALVDAGGATVSGATLSWNVGSLSPGANGQLQFRVSALCSASELTNSSYSIASTQVPSGVAGAPVVTPVTAASSDPVDVVVSSVPARAPLRSGDLVTHAVTLTNTVAEERRGLRFVMNPGGDAAFESVLDPGTGAMSTPNPFNWSWTGNLGPNASTDVVFTTRIDDCLNLPQVALNNRQPIVVRNVCGVVVGEGNPAQIPLEAPLVIKLSVLGLPPERVEDDFLLARPGETFQLQMSLTERYGQDQTAVSIDLPLPAGLSAVGDPPFTAPTDPGATWDAATATASWSGT
ncbi:MAG: InlB B-repeat-containing protein, partial [Gemmatimonadota bacterium]